MDFIIDTEGDTKNLEDETLNNSSIPTESTKKLSTKSIIQQIVEEYNSSSISSNAQALKLSKKDEVVDAFANINELIKNRKKLKRLNSGKECINKSKIEEVLQKSVITPEFEQLHKLPSYDPAEKKLKEMRQREREKTKGKKWYGLPATEVTEEVKRDLEVLQMRSVLDPKHFYKKNDLKVLPKYFQIGKVMDSPLDYYNNRCTKKERKKTLVDELMADAEFNKFNKRRYREIIDEQKKTHYKAYKQAKKLKHKKK